jgi:hypothetical protein
MRHVIRGRLMHIKVADPAAATETNGFNIARLSQRFGKDFALRPGLSRNPSASPERARGPSSLAPARAHRMVNRALERSIRKV